MTTSPHRAHVVFTQDSQVGFRPNALEFAAEKAAIRVLEPVADAAGNLLSGQAA
ncbi:hypothetical protein [Streptomyces sp. NPDC001851]|uniref:hypothetical protein n=1 Tax=Streptomyces sp. NPDC001851 TaxID=3154529 RepID=UPI003322E976